MTNRERKYLSDILGAIDFINGFIGEMEFSEYLTDYKTKGAVERYMGIIGEAVVNLRRENPTIALSESDKIIGFRNILVHSYDSVDDEIVWFVCKNSLPNLSAEVKVLLLW